MKDWIKGLFSLEERKFSTIMLSFISFTAIGVYILLKTETIPMQLVYLILGLGGYVVGINAIPGMFNSSNSMYGSSYNTSYGSNMYGTTNYGMTNTTMNTTNNPTANTTSTTNTSQTKNPV